MSGQVSNIHELINRLVLRKRWILWSLRNFRPGDYKPKGRHMRLSARLHAHKPIKNFRDNFDADMLGDPDRK